LNTFYNYVFILVILKNWLPRLNGIQPGALINCCYKELCRMKSIQLSLHLSIKNLWVVALCCFAVGQIMVVVLCSPIEAEKPLQVEWIGLCN